MGGSKRLNVYECPIKNPSSGASCSRLFTDQLTLGKHLAEAHIKEDIAGYLAQGVVGRNVE